MIRYGTWEYLDHGAVIDAMWLAVTTNNLTVFVLILQTVCALGIRKVSVRLARF